MQADLSDPHCNTRNWVQSTTANLPQTRLLVHAQLLLSVFAGVVLSTHGDLERLHF